MVMLPNGKDFKLITSCTGKFSSGLTLPGPGGKGILGRCNCATQIVVGTTSRKVVACSRSSWGHNSEALPSRVQTKRPVVVESRFRLRSVLFFVNIFANSETFRFRPYLDSHFHL